MKIQPAMEPVTNSNPSCCSDNARSLTHYPTRELLTLIFGGTIMTPPIYIPTNSAQRLPFLQTFASTSYLLSF